MSGKTLVAYETKGGATEEAARKIADTLRAKHQLTVDLVDLKVQNVSDCSQYQNIVIGSGVRAGKLYSKALKCLENDYAGKRVAFFVCCGGAGDPKNYEKSKAQYAEDTLARYPKIAPIGVEAFGGKMTILGRKVIDNLDLAKVESWADEIGKKFAE